MTIQKKKESEIHAFENIKKEKNKMSQICA